MALPVVRWMSRAFPILILGFPLLVCRPATPPRSGPQPLSYISSERESLPFPIHDEATCAFCQAAAFAPHAGNSGGILPVVWGSEHQTVLSYDDRLTHDGATRSPRSRDPPTLQ
jgi:hypothetical protein